MSSVDAITQLDQDYHKAKDLAAQVLDDIKRKLKENVVEKL
jgi:hypothetical protein